MLKESLQQFTAPVYGKTQRSSATYKTLADRCKQKLTELKKEYAEVKNDQQLLREIRNDIDYYLRRYHEYCIKQRDGMGAHYHEQGADAETDFEHLVPAKIAPVREGKYEVKTKDGREYHAMFNGRNWHNEWSPDEELKIAKWRGVAYNPEEHFVREELDKIVIDYNNIEK